MSENRDDPCPLGSEAVRTREPHDYVLGSAGDTVLILFCSKCGAFFEVRRGDALNAKAGEAQSGR